MIDAIWFYEKDIDVENRKLYPETPVGSWPTEITDLDFDDTEQIKRVVADLEKMGADFIAVLPDFLHHHGFLYPHIAVSFPNEKQVGECIGKYGPPRRSIKYCRPETTKLVYDEYGELLGRTLDDEEYTSVTAEELITAIGHSSWGLGVIDTDNDGRFTMKAEDNLNKMSAEQLREFIQENGGLIIILDVPEERNVFPVFSKGPRKGYPNYKKEPETFYDRWYEQRRLRSKMIAKSTRDKARRIRALDFINASKRSARCIHCGLADPRCIEYHHWNPDR
jgi:hypothetical protein